MSVSVPKRYIYSAADMQKFRQSPARQELLAFAASLGRSCQDQQDDDGYDPDTPLAGLSAAMASLFGSLRAMERWVDEIPPDEVRARFGNPAFKKWHARLVERSEAIVSSILDWHDKSQSTATSEQLEEASAAGFIAASSSSSITSVDHTQQHGRMQIVEELKAYLNDAFGHPIRIDYGTGHECSFLVFLYSLGKIGCLGTDPRSPACLRPIALSIFSQYLKVTRGVQTTYILEPAGTHGVWGLDDYHCLPFYFGACQLIHNQENLTPTSIHDTTVLEQMQEKYMYFACIRYIRFLKKGVPFFESSPMLNDVSHLPSWEKVSAGLLRLYEGEVLDKLPVVQHFKFGNIFRGTCVRAVSTDFL